jgi:hypothetical protein
MVFLKTIFDETFVHMAVGFVGMILGAFLVVMAAGSSLQRAHTVPAQAASSDVR